MRGCNERGVRIVLPMQPTTDAADMRATPARHRSGIMISGLGQS